jgi:hypothetical protein
MMEVVRVSKLNEVYVKIDCEPSTAYELNDYFTFDVPGAKFMPSYKNKMWDGKIRLFNTMTLTLYTGLVEYLEKFCASRNYQVEYDDNFYSENFSVKEAKDFVSTLGTKFEPRDYQLEAFVHAIRQRTILAITRG